MSEAEKRNYKGPGEDEDIPTVSFVGSEDEPGEEFTIKILNWMYEEEFKSVKLLGVDEGLEWSFNRRDGLTIKTPDKKPCEHGFSFKITRNFNINEPE